MAPIQKQKSLEQKQYELLRSVNEQIEQQLHGLKREEQILLKLIEREQRRLRELKNDSRLKQLGQTKIGKQQEKEKEKFNKFGIQNLKQNESQQNKKEYVQQKQKNDRLSGNKIQRQKQKTVIRSQNNIYVQNANKNENMINNEMKVYRMQYYKMDEELYEDED